MGLASISLSRRFLNTLLFACVGGTGIIMKLVCCILLLHAAALLFVTQGHERVDFEEAFYPDLAGSEVFDQFDELESLEQHVSKQTFMHMIPLGGMFTASLAGKHGSHTYQFLPVTVKHPNPTIPYAKIMLRECKKHGMKPVCDFAKYCKKDKKSLFIGQKHYISDPRTRTKGAPHGFARVAFHWKGLCGYTGSWTPGTALCDRGNTHQWRTAEQSPSFMCGKLLPPSPKEAKAATAAAIKAVSKLKADAKAAAAAKVAAEAAAQAVAAAKARAAKRAAMKRAKAAKEAATKAKAANVKAAKAKAEAAAEAKEEVKSKERNRKKAKLKAKAV